MSAVGWGVISTRVGVLRRRDLVGSTSFAPEIRAGLGGGQYPDRPNRGSRATSPSRTNFTTGWRANLPPAVWLWSKIAPIQKANRSWSSSSAVAGWCIGWGPRRPCRSSRVPAKPWAARCPPSPPRCWKFWAANLAWCCIELNRAGWRSISDRSTASSIPPNYGLTVHAVGAASQVQTRFVFALHHREQ